MRFSFLLFIVCLMTLTSCVEDSKSGLNRQPETNTPTLTAEREFPSQMNRNRGSSILSYKGEISQVLNNTLPSVSYRIVPDMTMDDEKSGDTVTQLNRPAVTCGANASFENITQRINDCELLNGTRASWSGVSYSTSGEGPWKLVTRTSAGQEIWMDVRTGMVWSDLIEIDSKSLFNWCQASGNEQGTTTVATTDCQTLHAGVNVCVNNSMLNIGNQIQWRLPTRNDFLQADINGSRYVLKSSTNGLWTATMKAGVTGRTQAWVYMPEEGTLSPAEHLTEKNVRCIGAPRL